MASERRDILKSVTGIVVGIGVTIASLPFLKSMGLSERAKARGRMHKDIDITTLKEGNILSISFQNNPVVILRRTKKQIEELSKLNTELVDFSSSNSVQPEGAKNFHRSLVPELFVVNTICTHLGCSVTHLNENPVDSYQPEGGYYCPCHGSKYDMAGRVYKNMPAPKNLFIPNYEIIDENTVRLISDKNL